MSVLIINPPGTLAIGKAVGSGTANCVLYIDASGNLAQSVSFTFDGTTLIAPTVSSPGAGTRSEHFGATSSTSTYDDSVAVGYGSSTGAIRSVAIGSGSTAGTSGTSSGTSIGYQASSSNFGISIGFQASGGASRIAIGSSISVPSGARGILIGTALSTTDFDQYVYGQQYNPVPVVRYCTFMGGSPDPSQGHSFRIFGSTTTQGRTMFQFAGTWVNSTDASRLSRVAMSVFDSASDITSREFMRAESSGSVAMLGFFGHTASAQPSAYTPTNVTTKRSFDASSASLSDALNVIGTMIADLQTLGLVA